MLEIKKEETKGTWKLKMFQRGYRACYVFRKYQFNTDYSNLSFRKTRLLSFLRFFLQTNEEDLFQISISPIYFHCSTNPLFITILHYLI
jgi:hypothetical protein